MVLLSLLGVDVVEKSKSTVAFSKTDSMCLKGLAIFLLMCIHCFGATERFAGFDFIFWPLSEKLYVDLAYYCKICVSMFAFISGYGLYLSARKNTGSINDTNKWMLSRYFKTMGGFWFVYVIAFVFFFFVKGLPQKIYLEDGMVRGVVYILLDFLGVSGLFGTPRLNGSWWYMSAALIFVVFVPLLIKWTDKLGWFSLLAVLVIFPRLLFNNECFGASNPFTFIPAVYFGALFARFKIFEKIEDFKLLKNKYLNEFLLFVIGLIGVFASIYVWIRVSYKVLWEYHFAVAPLFVIVFCNRFVFRQGGVIRKAINTVFAFLGKHSMNIFVIHTFYRIHLLEDFLYNMKYPILTIVSLLLISLVTSIVFEFMKKVIKYNNFVSFLEKKALSLFPASN